MKSRGWAVDRKVLKGGIPREGDSGRAPPSQRRRGRNRGRIPVRGYWEKGAVILGCKLLNKFKKIASGFLLVFLLPVQT